MPFTALPATRFPRRALLAVPVVGGLAFALYPRERTLPDPSQQGSGPEIELTLFSRTGKPQRVVTTHSLLRRDDDWRRELTADEFAITRRKGTEFAFANRYWNNRKAGLYRCVCCGNALFRSEDQFDSGTGWPSFSAPCAQNNIRTEVDSRYSLQRLEVLCSKCNAHLGHVFNDGPPPTGLRYCLNSVALRLVTYQ